MDIIEKFLNKTSESFTKKDIIKFIKENNIEIINFRYIADDGRLKTLNFPANDIKYVDKILTCGERLDGSSLFKGIDSSSSDLYIIPKYSSVFVNPFSEIPAIDIICNFYDKEGNPFVIAPGNILRKAEKIFKEKTGFEFNALGELEYYVISPRSNLYPTMAQKGYHESYPFNKWEFLRTEALNLISHCGGHIKYAHSEVGFIKTEEQEMSQNEIEFLPVPLSRAADEIVISKWILSSLGYKYGVVITFAPKILIGHAGSGFHIHSALLKNGKNVMLKNEIISEEAKKLIAGFLKSARSLTAFGNTVPTSYLRLVPNQEAPINICWGYRNRSALIRVPLSGRTDKDMSSDLNYHPKNKKEKFLPFQTIEFRSADGSANPYLLLAGLACAGIAGFEMKDAVNFADKHFVAKNIHKENDENIKRFNPLPSSCSESADELIKDREIYQKYDIFPSQLIDSIANKLKNYNDKDLSEKLYGKDEEIKKIVEEYLYC